MNAAVPAEITPFPDKPGTEKTGMFRDFFLKTGLSASSFSTVILTERIQMKIINLIENTEGRSGCACAHGLSFYIETRNHRLLLDLGPSGETLKNAQTLGIDLAGVDTVILSHGHYDHSGGILPFAQINKQAAIYMQESATGDYYSDRGSSAPERYEYIGIDKNIAKLPRVRFLQGDFKIDEELELFTIKKRSHSLPTANRRILLRKGDHFQCDDFVHEQFLVIRQSRESILSSDTGTDAGTDTGAYTGADTGAYTGVSPGDGSANEDMNKPLQGDLSILMSGCAHSGILSILDAFCEKYGKAPDLAISGFHLMKKTEYTGDEIREIEEIARELRKYSTRFITCHCTGIPAFNRMKEIMGDQLEYVHSGEEIDLSLFI